jgi:hypothetical protein
MGPLYLSAVAQPNVGHIGSRSRANRGRRAVTLLRREIAANLNGFTVVITGSTGAGRDRR